MRVYHRLGRLQAQAAQSPEVPDPIARLGAVPRAKCSRRSTRCGPRAACALPFDPAAPPVEQAPDWSVPPRRRSRQSRAAWPPPNCAVPAFIPRRGRSPTTCETRLSSSGARPICGHRNRPGYATVVVTVPLGDFTGQQMRVLAELTQAYSDGSARVTADQNFVMRWVRRSEVPELYRRLAAAGLGLAGADTLADVGKLPGRRVLQAGGHAVARTRTHAGTAHPRRRPVWPSWCPAST